MSPKDAGPAGTGPGDSMEPSTEARVSGLKDGAAILNRVREELTRYVVFPSPEAAAAYTLWIAATHAQASWQNATRLVFKSPIKRCGKTRAQEIGRELVHEPISTTNISVAALVRSIDDVDPPTLILDEADAIFGAKRQAKEGAEDLRGILNAGHAKGWPYIRWDPTKNQRVECATFAMALIGGIGDMPDTIEDRAVIVTMRRRAPGERIEPFRRRRVVPHLHELQGVLHHWVASLDLGDVDPPMPVQDRDADKWEPLVAIADAAGDHWPHTARRACLTFCKGSVVDEATAGERLLEDLRAVWPDAREEELFTTHLLDRLRTIEEAPWGDWYGHPLNARDLARLLRPYGVSSRNVRIGDGQAKGYARADLLDPWTRYLTASGTPSVPSVPASQEAEDPGHAGDASAERIRPVSVPTPSAELVDRLEVLLRESPAPGYWIGGRGQPEDLRADLVRVGSTAARWASSPVALLDALESSRPLMAARGICLEVNAEGVLDLWQEEGPGGNGSEPSAGHGTRNQVTANNVRKGIGHLPGLTAGELSEDAG